MKSWRLAAILTVMLALGSGSALAGSPEEEKQARRSFERAEVHFKAGLFAEALAEYRSGYDHMPLPGFLINIAQCQRRLGDLVSARATYAKFLMVAPDSPYVEEIKSLIVELDKLIDASERATPPEAAKGGGAADPLQPAPVDKALPSAARPVEAPTNQLVQAPELSPLSAEGGTRWWLWGGLGAAVVAGATVAAVLLWPANTTTLHEGSLGTLRR